MKVAFYTLGCKVNQYETDLMMANFKESGYEIVEFGTNKRKDIADIYVINSCSVTNLAARKTRNYLSRAKKYNPNSIVILVGCYSQEVDSEILNLEKKIVDIILGNEEKKDIVKSLEEYLDKNNIQAKKLDMSKTYKVSNISLVKKYSDLDVLKSGNEIRESIKIEDGCNNFCTYCIIPYLRGRVRSKLLSQILEESKNLVNSGVKELVIVGIEIASYGLDLNDGTSLITILEELNKINGLERIRLGSIEPRWLTDENIERLAKLEKICNHFHISIQSMDDNVLARMNRKYNVQFVKSRIDTIRKNFKNVAFTTDIIVGFPGETDEEFNNTFNNLKQLEFKEIHVFKYSKRKYTKAATMQNQVEGTIATKRSDMLLNLSKYLNNSYINNLIGNKLEVLFESFNEGFVEGYTSNYIKVKVKGDKELCGKIQEVELISLEKDILVGKI